MIVAKLATFAVFSCKNQSQLTEIDSEAYIWILKKNVISRNLLEGLNNANIE